MLLVAVVDTAFWPVLRQAFYVAEDVLSGRDRLGLSEHAWRVLRSVLLGLFAVLVVWVFVSAARHHQDLTVCFEEFLSTWPAARVTETFKLMSGWALLVEYGMARPSQSPANKSWQHASRDPKREPLLSVAALPSNPVAQQNP